MSNIINDIKELQGFGRPLGKIEAAKFFAFAQEAELLYVKPILGDKLYNEIVANPTDEKYETLLNGGTWTDDNEDSHTFAGLKVTISYYIYAQNLMSGDIQPTRFGNVIKENDYSTPITDKTRSDAYNSTLEIANLYMKDVVAYCNFKGLLGANRKKQARVAGAIRIRKIGG